MGLVIFSTDLSIYIKRARGDVEINLGFQNKKQASMITRSQSKKLKAEKDSQPLATSNEANKDVVPLDLVIEIFRRLPRKSLARFVQLSKGWRKIIRSTEFMTSFASPPRLLVVFIDLDRKRQRQDWYFFSPSSSSTSSLPRVTCPFPNPEIVEYHPHCVNGLISLGYGLEKTITNPSIGKSKILPRVETSSVVVRSFFGYEPVNDEYKVLALCMTDKTLRRGRERAQVSSQHQVLTLGAETETWKMIKYKIPHEPLSNSVCIDGVLYYVAATGAPLLQRSLMRFGLGSEKLDLFTSLSELINNRFVDEFCTLISYEGKVAFPTKTSTYEFEVWVMDQHAKELGWSKISFSLEPWKNELKLDYLHVRGSTHTGEFVLAPRYYYDDFNVIHYNPDTKSFRNTKVEVYADYEFKRRGTKAVVFSDYVDSLRLL